MRPSALSELTFSALFDALPTAIGVLDAETHELVAANTRFAEVVGRPHGEIVGSAPPFPWVDEPESPAAYQPGARYECVFRHADGQPQPVEVSVREAAGPQPLLLVLVDDISEHRRMQQQLIQSGKLAAIGELAAGVAHEINNPLFAILGLTEFLLKDAEPGSRAHERLELIQQTGIEIREIVRALLDFARENTGDRREVALSEIVRTTVDLVRRTNAHKGIELIEHYEAAEALVWASPNQLKQVCLNLIANARQAMPHGGTVTIAVQRQGTSGLIVVSDDGPGIDPALAGRIFEPFFTTKRHAGGTGLGLSVSLGIAEGHGGSLTLHSEPGHGAAFTLRLPLADEGEE